MINYNTVLYYTLDNKIERGNLTYTPLPNARTSDVDCCTPLPNAKKKMFLVVNLEYSSVTKEAFECGVYGCYDNEELAQRIASQFGMFAKVKEI